MPPAEVPDAPRHAAHQGRAAGRPAGQGLDLLHVHVRELQEVPGRARRIIFVPVLRLQFVVFFLSEILIERGVYCLESTRSCFCKKV